MRKNFEAHSENIKEDGLNIVSKNPKGTDEYFESEDKVELEYLCEMVRKGAAKIVFKVNGGGKETASVMMENEVIYFTDITEEVTNFHVWEALDKERAENEQKGQN